MAKENNLQYIILGLLAQESRTGYDIKKVFNEEIGDFWNASHGQIYPELQRLENQGYISIADDADDTTRNKKYYLLTEKGKAMLDEWINAPLGNIKPTKDLFTIKLYLSDHKEDPHTLQLLKEELERHEGRLSHLQARLIVVGDSSYGHNALLRYAVDLEEFHLKWLKTELEAIQK